MVNKFFEKVFGTIPSLFLIFLISVQYQVSFAANKCSLPPFVGAGVKPNVVIMLDNSGSMKVPMYRDPDFGGWKCSNGTHNNFDPSVTYYGIFESDKKYKYDSNIPVDPNPWDGGSGDPYNVTVDTTVTGAFVEDNTCTIGPGNNCWDGNFLNWLVTRRIDAARKALVGGKVEDRSGYDYITGGDKEWKILGNNERSDHDFCKQYANGSACSPYPDNTTFKIWSPANDGKVKTLYDPYAKLEAIGTFLIQDSGGNNIGEICTVSLNHNWVTVNLQGNYSSAPIVVAGPLSYNGSDPSVVRIRNVTENSFEIRVQEWLYKDGTHKTEHVHCMVVKEGTHTLPGNIKLVAGKVDVSEVIDVYGCGVNCCSGDKIESWKTVSLSTFPTNPVVKTSIITFNESDTVTTRVKDVTASSFKVALEEEEEQGPHATEEVAYIAVEQGTVDFGNGVKMEIGKTTKSVDHNWYTISFSEITNASIFLADMQTTEGSDTATLRYRNLSSSSVEIKVEEEESCDGTGHPNSEEVGYIVFQIGETDKYNIALIVEEEPKGIVQDVVDKVRLGISFYRYTKDTDIYNGNEEDGGTLKLSIPKNPFVKNTDDVGGYRTLNTHLKADVGDIIDAIEHYPLVWGTTPLAENYYELVRYFKQENPYYDINAYETNNDWDPYYYSEFGRKEQCAHSFIVVFTDGEPFKDFNVPPLSGCTGGGPNIDDNGPDCDNDGHEPKNPDPGVECNKTGSNANHDYLDDVTHWAHNNDLRSDDGMDGEQAITTYAVIFGTSEQCSQYTDQTSCEAGGCTWLNDECRPGTTSERCRQQIMIDTADNGEGEFYYAADGAQLARAFTSIMESIMRTGSAGAVATVTQEVVGEDIVLRGAFTTYEPEDPTTYTWRGHLEVYWPYEGCSSYTGQSECEEAGCTWEGEQCTGLMYSFQKEENEGKFCSDSGFSGGHCWDAGERMPSAIDRTIFTVINGTKTNFTAEQASTLSPYLQNDIDFDGDGDVDQVDAEVLINWVRGNTTYDGDTARNRSNWSLGDIVYSTPVVVGTPVLASVPEAAVGDCSCTCVTDGSINESCAKQCFYCYRYKHLHRKKVIYVGANDGMLHAFVVAKWDSDNEEWVYDPSQDSEIGKELWAFIPSNLLSELKELARPKYGKEAGCQHRYMVDLSPDAWDVYIDHDGTKEWRTVLIGGERGGGDIYFAIDVTDPDSPQVLWEHSVVRNMLVNISGTQTFPFSYDDYLKIKNLPLSWSVPYVGRLNWPIDVIDGYNPIWPLYSSDPSPSSLHN